MKAFLASVVAMAVIAVAAALILGGFDLSAETVYQYAKSVRL